MDIRDEVEKAFSGRWIAGRTTDDAAKLTKKFNKYGASTVLNYMGIGLIRKDSIEDAVSSITELIGEIKKRKINSEVSTKVTQLGSLVDKKMMFRNYRLLVETAKKRGIFVWLDIEEVYHVPEAHKLYLSMVKSGNTGLSLQAYLKRSMSDAKKLLKAGATIRLVKGAYSARKEVGYTNMDDITANYMRIMEYLFKNAKGRFVIASHDPIVIERAMELERKYKKSKVQYAMLNGIRNRYATHLANEGKNVSVYVPFGKRWIEFGLARLTVMHNLKLVMGSFFEDQRIEP